MTENKKYEKGSLGWLREQAKKDGFGDDIKGWQNWKRKKINDKRRRTSNILKFKNMIQNIDRIVDILEENKVEIRDELVFYKFWSHVDIKDNIKECWNWTGYIKDNEYGQFSSNNTIETCAHRIAYMLAKGPISEGDIQHLCNNRRCCNPNHLKFGTRSENMQYAVKCHRWNNYGENNGHSIITEDKVREIRKIYEEQRKLYPDLRQWQIEEPIAQKFGISKRSINSIINRTNWHHI